MKFMLLLESVVCSIVSNVQKAENAAKFVLTSYSCRQISQLLRVSLRVRGRR
jgi:hypothetical protein